MPTRRNTTAEAATVPRRSPTCLPSLTAGLVGALLLGAAPDPVAGAPAGFGPRDYVRATGTPNTVQEAVRLCPRQAISLVED